MKMYETIEDYLEDFKVGEWIALEGFGLMSGLNVQSKHDVFKVHESTTRDEIVLREYRGRTSFLVREGSYGQKVKVIPPKVFKELPKLW